MTIIAATDFSPAAANATASAVLLARKLGDALLLVRVVEEPIMAYPELGAIDIGTLVDSLRASNEARMKEVVDALAAPDLRVTGRVLFGNPPQVLASHATEVQARLIVTGSHGRGPVGRFFLGSVAERTVLEAPCPVLVIPPEARPFDDWAGARRALRVLVGLDLDSTSEDLLWWLANLREAGPCQATVIHTYWPPAEYARLGLQGPRDLLHDDSEIVAVLEREIRSRTNLAKSDETTTLRIRSGWDRLADALAVDAASERSDLVLMGTHQQHGWQRIKNGSHALATVRSARTAMLCVPARHGTGASTSAPIPTIRRVLVPTDFSELGNTAIPHAYSLLRGTGGFVDLCHVHEHYLPSPIYAYSDPSGALSAEKRTELERCLSALIPAEAEGLGIATRVTAIDGGSAAEAVLQAARRLGADAITIASHGRSGLARSLFGSVTEAVVRGFDKPVFVVRPPNP